MNLPRSFSHSLLLPQCFVKYLPDAPELQAFSGCLYLGWLPAAFRCIPCHCHDCGVTDRMKYMERRGSGLRKIVSETEKLPGYTEAYKPEFSSTATDFRVILKNVNYNLEGDAHQVIHQVTHQVIELSTVSKQILAFCTTPKSKKELAVFCGFKDLRNFTLKHINPLLESGQLEMTIPDKPKSRNQKYITVRSE